MNTSVKAVLYTSKTLKNGEHPLLLRLTRDRKQLKISLGISCLASDWDDKTNRPKKKHPLYQEIKRALDKAEHDAEKVILDFENNDRSYTLEDIKSKLAKAQNRSSVYAYFSAHVERLRSAGRIGYADIFHATKKSLMGFRGESDFGFSEITPAFLSRWEESLLEKGTKPNSIFVYMRTLKTLVNEARKEEVIPENLDPFKGISFAKYRRIKTRHRAITKDELNSIKAVALPEGSKIAEARDLFLFSYYCRGINFVDMAYLKWTEVRAGRIFYTRRKTKENFSFKLLEPAEEIISYYRDLAETAGSPYVFPILNDSHKTEQQRDNRVQKVLRRVNAHLKEIARMAEVDIPLTTYVARHSFATVLKQEGVPIAVISEMMGHDSETTTRIYLKAFEDEVLDSASRALL